MAKISAHGTELGKVWKTRTYTSEFRGEVTEQIVHVLCSDGTILEKIGENRYGRMDYMPYHIRAKVKPEYATAKAWIAKKQESGWAEGDPPTGHEKQPRTWTTSNEITDEYRRAIHACFPAWKGKKIHVKIDTYPHKLSSYWDGGSRDYYAFYNTLTKEVLSVHSNHPMFEHEQPDTLRELPPHVLLLEHSIFCGKDAGITIYAVTTPVQSQPALIA